MSGGSGKVRVSDIEVRLKELESALDIMAIEHKELKERIWILEENLRGGG